MSRSGVGAEDAHLCALVVLRADGLVYHLVEGPVEILYHLAPRYLAVGYAVELLLDVGREVVVHDLGELRLEIVIHHHAYIRRRETVLLLAETLRKVLLRDAALCAERQLRVGAALLLAVLLDNISAIYDRGDRGGICRRAAYAQLLELLHERSLVVTCRRRRETLRSRHLRSRHLLALDEFGQGGFAALRGLIVCRLGVETQESVEAYDLSRCTILPLRAVHADGYRRAVDVRGNHL